MSALTLFIELPHIIQQAKLLNLLHEISPAALIGHLLLLHAHVIEEVGASEELLVGENRICAARWARAQVGVERAQPVLLLLAVFLRHFMPNYGAFFSFRAAVP